MAVVVPHYQRERGLLARTIESIAAQEHPEDVRLHVIVVDDGSPVPASSELPAPTAGVTVEVVTQENAGVSAARNAALDRLPRDCAFVAFLDSDDVWLPGHVARAARALDAGASLFFADTIADGARSFGRFPYVDAVVHGGGHPSGPLESEPPSAPVMALAVGSDFAVPLASPVGALAVNGPPDDVLTVPAASLRGAFLADCPAHTSTVAIRRDALGDLRFDTSLRHAGEDHLMWSSILFRATSVAIGVAPGARRGHGIDLFRSTVDWNAPGALSRIHDNLRKAKRLRALAGGEGDLDDLAARVLARDRAELATVLIRNLLRHSGEALKVAFSLLRSDPATLFAAPWFAFWFRPRSTRPERSADTDRSA